MTGKVRYDAETLYRLCQRGDEEAWRALYSWCRLKALRIMAEEADDVAQQVCLNMMEGGLDKLRNPKAFLGYTGRSVRNEVANRLRSRSRLVSINRPASSHDGEAREMVDAMPANESGPDQSAVSRIALEQLMEMFDELPDYCERVMSLYLRYLMGLAESYQEMADLLNVGINTLSVQIKRCLDKLKGLAGFKELQGLLED